MIGTMHTKQASLLAADLKALAHPSRILVIEHLVTTEGPASPNQMAQLTGESLGRMSYHVRQLLGKKMIRLVRTEPRRGAVEHFYTVTPKGEKAYRRVAPIEDT